MHLINSKKIRIFSLGTLFFLAGILLPLLTSAVTRSTYFTQSARNVTVDGVSDPASSTCVISISNPSSQDQNYTLKTTVMATGTEGAGPAAFTDCSDGTVCTNTGTGTFSCTGASPLTGGSSVSCTFTYPEYRARPTVTAGNQNIVCSGSVVATDPGNPGFLIAGGSLVSFSESGALQTTNATGATTFFAGQAVYSQIPISINGGKPF